MLRVGLSNFSKGELSDELLARIDVPSYSAGLRRARNVIVLKYGGVQKRPGTRLVAEVYNADKPVRLIPFQFSLTQAYALELGENYLRVAANGGLVLETQYTITAITKATQAQVTVALHGYSVGQQVYFSGALGMVEINGRTGTVVSVPDANTFVVDIDSRLFSTFSGDSGGIVNSSPPADPPAGITPPAVPDPPVAPPDTGGGGSYEGGSGGVFDTGGGAHRGREIP